MCVENAQKKTLVIYSAPSTLAQNDLFDLRNGESTFCLRNIFRQSVQSSYSERQMHQAAVWASDRLCLFPTKIMSPFFLFFSEAVLNILSQNILGFHRQQQCCLKFDGSETLTVELIQ